MAFNADLATATSLAPQLGTLSGTTTPTSTQATVVWGRAYDQIRMALARVGVSSTVTGSSIAEGYFQRIEMFLASGEILLAKGSIGAGAESTAQQLITVGQAMLAGLAELRPTLLDNGASGSAGTKDSRVDSHWLRAKDPKWDPTPGTGDPPYASTPTFPDDADL